MYRNILGIVGVLLAGLLLAGLTFSSTAEERADYVFGNGTEPKTLDPQRMTGQPEGRIADALFWFDRNVIDGTVNGIGRVTIGAGRELRQVQTGRVQNYALGIAVGLIVMAGSYLILAGSN